MIEILLATYNGERFLSEQIESIINQSYTDYKILASDDNSSDCTFEILRSYESVLGEKINVVQSNTHSAKENFCKYLLKRVYIQIIFIKIHCGLFSDFLA